MDANLAEKIFELLQTGEDAIYHIDNGLKNGEITLSDIAMLDSINEMLTAVEVSTLAEAIVPNRVKEINANLAFYIEQMKNDISENQDRFLYDFRFHFHSLYRILKYEIAYIFEKVVNKDTYPEFYPEVVKVDHQEIIERGKNTRCKASVILLAYNNLQYTRDCVESILEYTNDVDYELILVNNGSTDGTKDYFDSIAGAKVIHLEYNLHVVKGFNIGMMAAEGKYCAVVCNDFIFTHNWLKNLMTCIESDSEIGYVSPGATNISNMQQIEVPFTSIKEFQENAKKYNVSDSKKWEERVVLLPNVLCCPTVLLDRIGYYDTRYFRGEFGDDDISFLIRRQGYKLVYCGDTVVHHYGSLTTGSDHQTNSLEEGRAIFIQKYGLDAWADARMNSFYLNINYSILSNTKSILGIDVKCGANLMQIKNKIWSDLGVKPSVFTLTTEEKYGVDLRTISEKVFLLNNLQKLPEELYGKFDLVYIEKPLDCYLETLDTIFENLSRVMNENGRVIFMVNNNSSIESLYQMDSIAMHNRKIYQLTPLYIKATAYGFTNASVLSFTPSGNEEVNQDIDNLAKMLTRNQNLDFDKLKTMLQTTGWLFQMSFKMQ